CRTRLSRAAAGGNRGFWGGALGRDDLATRADAGPRAAAPGPARVPAEACDARLGPVPGGAGGHQAGEALPRRADAGRARPGPVPQEALAKRLEPQPAAIALEVVARHLDPSGRLSGVHVVIATFSTPSSWLEKSG